MSDRESDSKLVNPRKLFYISIVIIFLFFLYKSVSGPYKAGLVDTILAIKLLHFSGVL